MVAVIVGQRLQRQAVGLDCGRSKRRIDLDRDLRVEKLLAHGLEVLRPGLVYELACGWHVVLLSQSSGRASRGLREVCGLWAGGGDRMPDQVDQVIQALTQRVVSHARPHQDACLRQRRADPCAMRYRDKSIAIAPDCEHGPAVADAPAMKRLTAAT